MIVLGHKLNDVKTRRAGVIPYVIKNKEMYFLMGIDRKTKDLTDFGGGVKINESALTAAIREFKEETKKLFPDEHYSINNFVNCVSITDEKEMSIVFLCVKQKWLKKAKRNFDVRSFFTDDEISNVVWMNEYDFFDAMFNKQNQLVWKKIQNFFIRHISWVRKNELVKMLKQYKQ